MNHSTTAVSSFHASNLARTSADYGRPFSIETEDGVSPFDGSAWSIRRYRWAVGFSRFGQRQFFVLHVWSKNGATHSARFYSHVPQDSEEPWILLADVSTGH